MSQEVRRVVAALAIDEMNKTLVKAAEPLCAIPDAVWDLMIDAGKAAMSPAHLPELAADGKALPDKRAAVGRALNDLMLTAKAYRAAARAYAIALAEDFIDQVKEKDAARNG